MHGGVAIESRVAPTLPDSHSYLVVRVSQDGDSWTDIYAPPFAADNGTVRCWPNEQIPALVEWWFRDSALALGPSLLDPEERAEADRLIAAHAGTYH